MNRRDLLAGLFWLGISVFVVIQSVKSDIGSWLLVSSAFKEAH